METNGSGPSSQLIYTGTQWQARDVLPLSKSLGILGGSEQSSVLHEIRRVHNAEATHRRRSAATVAGFATLIVLGGCGYLLAESIVSIVHLSQPTATASTPVRVVNFVEVGLFGLATLFVLSAIPWLRLRRPTRISSVVMTSEYIAFMLQTAASILNGAFIYVWSSQIKTRCQKWAVDVAWWSPPATTCPSGGGHGLNGFLIAAGLRLLVVLILGAIWLYLLHRFSRLLPLSGDRLDQETVASLTSSEAIRAVLDRHDAKLVALAEGDVEHSTSETQLPQMPHERVLTDEEQIKEAQPQSTLGWIASSVAWFFGMSKPAPQSADFTRKDVSSPLLPMVERQAGPAFNASQFSNNPLHPDYRPYEAPGAAHFAQPSLPPSAYSGPFASTSASRPVLSSQTPTNYLPAFPTFFKGHHRTESDKAASVPLVPPPLARRPEPFEAQDSAAYDGIDTSWQEYDSQDSEDFSMERLDDSHHDAGNASQHSLLAPLPKQKVFVQMSDGHLVRKLSTICSDGTGEMSRSDSMDSSFLLGQELPGSWRQPGDAAQLRARH